MIFGNINSTDSVVHAVLSRAYSASSASLITKDIYDNGWFYAVNDGADGYSAVYVDVNPHLSSLATFESNGLYSASQYGFNGWQTVNVRIPLTSLSVSLSQGGSYVFTPGANYAGYSEVRIDVPQMVTAEEYSAMKILASNPRPPWPDMYYAFQATSGSTAVYDNRKVCFSQNFFNGFTAINDYAFANRVFSGSITFPSVYSIGAGAFYAQPDARKPVSETFSLYLPSCTSISAYAFGNARLEYLSAPLLSSIGTSAFYSTRLGVVDLPSCNIVEDSVFCRNELLTEVSLPVARRLGNYAFGYCSSLSSVYVPSATALGTGCFRGAAITEVSFPYCYTVSSWAFAYCESLQAATIGGEVPLTSYVSYATLAASCFTNCYNLLSLYLPSTAVAKLDDINAFLATPISTRTTSTGGIHGSIFVPASLVSAYKTSTNWVTYADRIVAMDGGPE